MTKNKKNNKDDDDIDKILREIETVLPDGESNITNNPSRV